MGLNKVLLHCWRAEGCARFKLPDSIHKLLELRFYMYV